MINILKPLKTTKKNKILSLVFVLALLISTPLFVSLVTNQRMEIRERAAGTTEINLIQFVVCPTGEAGQNDCDYIGGEGIQQAVDSAPVGDINNKTKILIKPGSYSRQSFSKFTTPSLPGEVNCFVDTKGKFLIFEGEGEVFLDGGGSDGLLGFCGKEGEVEIKKLRLSGFFSAISLFENIKAAINNNEIANNKQYGISLWDSSVITANNNKIIGNLGGIYLTESSQATINNNEIANNITSGIFLSNSSVITANNNKITGNRTEGISLYQSSQATINNNEIANNTQNGIILRNSSQATVTNNIFLKNGWHGLDLLEASSAIVVNNISIFNERMGIVSSAKERFTKLEYNLAFGNPRGDWNTTFGSWPPSSNITTDPKLINLEEGNFRLQAGSPAINAGDPEILDPDGSRSDIGVYGGPGAITTPTPPATTPPTRETTIPAKITSINSGQTIFTAQPTFSGTAAPKAKITISIRSPQTITGTTSADSAGNWSWTPSEKIPNGNHTITITAVDTQGNTSTTSATFTISTNEGLLVAGHLIPTFMLFLVGLGFPLAIITFCAYLKVKNKKAGSQKKDSNGNK